MQEACCVGMNDALTPDDSVITAYRAHGWTFIKGRTMTEVLSELTGMLCANHTIIPTDTSFRNGNCLTENI